LLAVALQKVGSVFALLKRFAERYRIGIDSRPNGSIFSWNILDDA
jgi:hypothetical protein